MRLSRIEVKNFRLLRDASIQLDNQLSTTILVGPNNSGKTSLVEILQLFAAGSAKGFSISDFSLACRFDFYTAQQLFLAENAKVQESGVSTESGEEVGAEPPDAFLPPILMTLYFDYQDIETDLAVAGDLLMDLDPQSYRVAIQTEFSVKDIDKLASDYRLDRENDEDLCGFLSTRLQDYYAISYFKVAPETGERERLSDRSVFDRMIKVDFIGAQRHIDDRENSQATRLSRLLHSHFDRRYKTANPQAYKELERALRTHSTDLSERYKQAFEGLVSSLLQFGHPRTPSLSIRAELSASTLFKDNTRLYYAAEIESQASDSPPANYDLPEKYNGLGFKNLIYMIVQLKSFREELEQADGLRPRVHLVMIEEPEVHLHPQVQCVFIKQISKFLNPQGADGDVQLLLTTHSSYIVADCGFSPVRYFRKKRGAVEVKDLLKFETSQRGEEQRRAIQFLARYLTLTRCDLFFCDKAILIEGQVERLLLPKMIEKCAIGPHSNLASEYISVVEVGGAYTHAFKSIIEFIEVPTLVITDLDSVGADRKKCRVADGISTSNATLKNWLPAKNDLAELRSATSAEKTAGAVQVAYQVPDEDHLPCGRSFEEAFIYCNADWLVENKTRLLSTGDSFTVDSAEQLRTVAYDLTPHKVEFALDLMLADDWKTPKYIADGLAWLAERGI